MATVDLNPNNRDPSPPSLALSNLSYCAELLGPKRTNLVPIAEADMKQILAITALVALAACGGGNRTSGTANGPIAQACLAADRSAASTSLCGCVQRVANAQLSSRDRARVATFFDDPEVAHAAKISDTPANDAFWARYQAFVRSARNTCG